MKNKANFTEMTLFVLLILVLAATAATGQAQSETSTAGGMRTITFVDAAGKIKIYLPDDMAAGDTISGTVLAEPNGTNESERAQNQSTLNGYVVDLGDGNKFPADHPRFSWKATVPPLASPTRFINKAIQLISQNGKTLGTANVPIDANQPSVAPGFNAPAWAQNGRPMNITGPFDGNSANTDISIGNVSIPVITESPRKVGLITPANMSGPTEVKITEGGKNVTAQTRIIAVNLSAPKTKLLKDERIDVKVKVSGLKGITAPVPLELVTTGTVKMDGGNNQNIQIDPRQVQNDGKFSQTFGLTGVQAGTFSVTGTVVTGGPVAGGDQCQCICEFADPPIVPSTKGKEKRSGHYSYQPNMKNAGCTGSKCTVKGKTYSWSVGAGSTATYTVAAGGDKTSQELSVDVTAAGTLELTVTVTVKCSDGTTCTATSSKTFDVDK
jgi:hypothetical protein